MRLLYIGNADNPLLVDLAIEVRRLRPGTVIDIVSERASRHPRAAQAFDRVLVPDGGGRMRTARGIKFLWFLLRYRALLKDTRPRYDAVHVFYLSAIWGALAGALARKGDRLIVSLFGSDVYRTNGILRPLQARLLARADRITAANADTLEAARHIASVDASASMLVRFGLRPLEHIERLRATGDRAAQKTAMGIDADRIVVVAGYNASRRQQHLAIIQALGRLPDLQRHRLHVILPMTMGGDAEHIADVRQALLVSGMQHRVITQLMTDEEVARMRLATDIMVQVQPTDQLAGAMQEHLCAGSVVITGSWLPYGALRDAGVRFWTIDALQELVEALRAAIDELDVRQQACISNAPPILGLSAWSHTAPRWSALYD